MYRTSRENLGHADQSPSTLECASQGVSQPLPDPVGTIEIALVGRFPS